VRADRPGSLAPLDGSAWSRRPRSIKLPFGGESYCGLAWWCICPLVLAQGLSPVLTDWIPFLSAHADRRIVLLVHSPIQRETRS